MRENAPTCQGTCLELSTCRKQMQNHAESVFLASCLLTMYNLLARSGETCETHNPAALKNHVSKTLVSVPRKPSEFELDVASNPLWEKTFCNMCEVFLTSFEVDRHSFRIREFSRCSVMKSTGFTWPFNLEIPWQNSAIVTRPSPSSKMSKRIRESWTVTSRILGNA